MINAKEAAAMSDKAREAQKNIIEMKYEKFFSLCEEEIASSISEGFRETDQIAYEHYFTMGEIQAIKDYFKSLGYSIHIRQGSAYHFFFTFNWE